jgi:ATP-dependent DNA helicase RecQ
VTSSSSNRSGSPSAEPQAVLQRVFGYSAFRGPQEAIVRHVLAGGSGLVLMPTGGGKSLCYQVPALCRAGLAVVISPLIALMQDQVEALQQLGVAAAGSGTVEVAVCVAGAAAERRSAGATGRRRCKWRWEWRWRWRWRWRPVSAQPVRHR